MGSKLGGHGGPPLQNFTVWSATSTGLVLLSYLQGPVKQTVPFLLFGGESIPIVEHEELDDSIFLHILSKQDRGLRRVSLFSRTVDPLKVDGRWKRDVPGSDGFDRFEERFLGGCSYQIPQLSSNE